MEIDIIGSFEFKDAVTNENSYLVIKTFRNQIGIGISQETSGDAEVYLDIVQCKSIIGWLQDGINKIETI